MSANTLTRNPLFVGGRTSITATYNARSRTVTSIPVGSIKRTLCGDCLRLDLHKLQNVSQDIYNLDNIPIYVFKLKTSFAALEQSAKVCGLCEIVRVELIQQGLKPGRWLRIFTMSNPVIVLAGCSFNVSKSKNPKSDSQFGIYGMRWQKMTKANNSLDHVRIACQDKLAILRVSANQDSPAAKSNHVLGRVIKPADDFERVRSWYTTCRNSHTNCKKVADNDFYPTRLVDVEGPKLGDETPANIKVILGSQAKGDYATLSHCWGLRPTIRSTRENLTKYMEGIPWQELSKTFQDAVHITRALGIKYLWIDSLCIVQDDYDEWEREAASMAFVYSNGCINIAASSAADGAGGCFVAYPELNDHDQVLVPYKDSDGKAAGDIIISPMLPRFEEDILDGPLSKRGWVVQEAALSKRKISYGRHQLYWRCPEYGDSESGFEDMTIDNGTDFSSSLGSVGMNGKINEEQYWYGIINQYSACLLTKDEDKLVALSGLARAFGSKFSYHYAAGLWEEYIWSGLLWHVASLSCHRYSEYRAPSWSWASINGPVIIDYNDQKSGVGDSKIEDIKIDVKIRGIDNFGSVSGGTMKLTGKLQDIQIELLKKPLGADDIWSPEAGKNVTLDVGNINAYLLDGKDRLGRAYLDENIAPTGTVYALLMDRASVFLHQRGEDATMLQNVLLLQSTGQEDEYRRIGKGRLCFRGSEGWFSKAEIRRIVII